MKAAIRHKYGSPSTIVVEKTEKPVIQPSEVLVKVHAATVNRTDCANLTAKPFIMRFVLGFFVPKQPVLGTDFAGVVEAVGDNVSHFAIGDRVFGFNDMGAASQATHLSVQASDLYHIPESIDFNQAAASLEGAHYAYSFIHKVKLLPGQRVLVNGATGAIGSALLQLLKPFEVHLSATCRAKHKSLVRNLGADEVFAYDEEDVTQSAHSFDFVFDTVGKTTFGQCKRILTPTGTYISSEMGPYAQNVYLPLFNGIRKRHVVFPIPFDKKETIPYISKQLNSGVFTPLIDRHYPLEDVSDAYRYVMTGQKVGNVVLSM